MFKYSKCDIEKDRREGNFGSNAEKKVVLLSLLKRKRKVYISLKIRCCTYRLTRISAMKITNHRQHYESNTIRSVTYEGSHKYISEIIGKPYRMRMRLSRFSYEEDVEI